MKKVAVSILIGLVLVTSLAGYSKKLSDELSDGIVRLHIVAESNSYDDQKVKLEIRDRILSEMKNFESADEIRENLALFENTANQVLEEKGFPYRAKAEYGRFDFPTKNYDNFSLPKGEYNAVKISLGKAEGENWWCVLFPPLCMVDAATDESDALLKETFGENYDVVKREKLPVKIKFKLAELF